MLSTSNKEVYGTFRNYLEIYFMILENNFDLKLDKNNKNIKDQNFFGKIIKFKARDLVYLIYLLEKKYDIVFSEDDIDNVSMYTINGLSEIVSEHLN